VLLLQIAAGTIMAHAYYDRRSFYGIALHDVLPFNFLRSVHIQSPIVSWIGAGLFLAPAIAGGREARGQGLLVELLFWVTLLIVAGALIGSASWATSTSICSGSATRFCPTSSSVASGRSVSSSGSCYGACWCSAHYGPLRPCCGRRHGSSGPAASGWSI
jgi:hypothetical protein